MDLTQFWVKVANFGKEYLYKEKDLGQDQGAMEDFKELRSRWANSQLRATSSSEDMKIPLLRSYQRIRRAIMLASGNIYFGSSFDALCLSTSGDVVVLVGSPINVSPSLWGHEAASARRPRAKEAGSSEDYANFLKRKPPFLSFQKSFQFVFLSNFEVLLTLILF